ncbi:MAG: c-type cytochrome [Pseudomonadales bacterium]
MRRQRLRVGLVGMVALAAGWFALPAVAADVAAGQAAYAVCAACHGQQGEGNAALNAPRIAGQESWYLRRQMEAYQQGLRGTANGDVYGMQMRPMSMAVSDPTALENLIAYIGTLPDVPAQPTIEGDVAAGQAAYAVCAACHGPAAGGVEQLGGPRLAGQNDWYLVRQIKNYQQGLRGYDPKDIFGNQMKPMASTLAGDKAINDVVAYINSLR